MSATDPYGFNLYIKRLREERGWSLRDVEKLSSKRISNAYLSQLETGRIGSPSIAIIHALSAVYGADFETMCQRALIDSGPLPTVPCCQTCGRPFA